jgi:hypothetical protein
MIMDLSELVDLSDLEDDGEDTAEYESYPRTEEVECM